MNKDILKSTSILQSTLQNSLDEEEYNKQLEESAKAFSLMQERARRNQMQAQMEEEEEEEDEEDEDDEEETNKIEQALEDDENKSKIIGFLSKTLKKVGIKTLIATGVTGGSLATIATLMIGMYRIHYTGEFEFKGISGEYQNFSFKTMNFSSFDRLGELNLSGLTKENKLAKTFYTFYSDNSYYAVVEDTKKYPNIDDAYKRKNLLTPSQLREQYPHIEDVEGREKMFQLNPDVLYSLDKYLHKDKALFPQQFIKPVNYNENKEDFGLKNLTDDEGRLTAKSQLFNSDGTLQKNNDGSLKKDYGVWDYGLASILHYKEFDVPTRQIINPAGRTITLTSISDDGAVSSKNEAVAQTHINKVPSGNIPPGESQEGTYDKGNREVPAYAIDKAVTPAGTITSKISQKWQEQSGTRKTYTVERYITEEEPYTVKVPNYTHDENGNSIQDGFIEETKYRIYTYKIVDTYEKYMEEYIPFYEGDPDTSEIVGSRYYREYIRNYSTYIPLDAPKSLDYTVFETSENAEKINQLLYDDAKPQETPATPETSEDKKDENKDNTSTGTLGGGTLRTMLKTAPNAGSGDLNAILQIGSKKDSGNVLNSLKYLPSFEKWGKTYGVDPYILVAMASQESGGNPNSSNGYAKGLMQIEHTVKKVTAFNHTTKQVDTFTVNHGNLFNPDYNIMIGAMEFAERFAEYNNILVALQGYNYGKAGIGSAIEYYLSGGKIGVNHTVDFAKVQAYAESNDTGWITATFPGDLPKEKNSAWGKNPSDGVHDARTWYSDTGYKKYGQGGGDCGYVEKIMRFYKGPDKPWAMKQDGTIVTVDGSAGSGFIGSSSPVGAFNSHLSSNWSSFQEVKGDLFPWSVELDHFLEKERTSDYENLKDEKLALRNNFKLEPNLTKTDENIALSMMFALNQGNYLSKYDYIGEPEWKAMYTQLLSSPTGKTWDDKWIGFTPEEVFGVSLDDLGTLFADGSGITPTISKPFGKLKNIYSESAEELPQYNEMNFGMDLAVPPDTEVLALEKGKVLSVEKDGKPLSRYGNFVEIEFNSKTRMIVANLKEVDKKIKKGAEIEKGQVLGKTGGESKSYKKGDLHVSVLYKGNYINPEWIITRDMKGFEDPIANNNGGVNCQPQQVSSSPVVNTVIEEAKKHIGKPYVWGATGPNSFDCSGFMYYIMKQSGLDVTRLTAIKYYEESTEVPRDQIQPGDLVFWHGTNKHSPVYHVGLYIGNDTVIDCSTDHGGVGTRKFSSLVDKKPTRYFTVGRYAPLSGGGSSTTSAGGCQVPGQVADNGQYAWPVPSSKNITSKFGPRWGKNHNGIDISAPEGAEVVASRAGEVIKTNDTCATTGSYGSRCGGGFGNYVYLKHSDGFVSIYPHMKKGSVGPKVGDKVSAGQKVGEIGSSGSSTGNHLHFEIKDASGKAVDPLTLVKP